MPNFDSDDGFNVHGSTNLDKRTPVKERRLKDTFFRSCEEGLVNAVKVDIRSPGYDTVTVYIRGVPVGSLVVDKPDSGPLANLLIPGQ